MSDELTPIDPKLEADLQNPDAIKPQFTPGMWQIRNCSPDGGWVDAPPRPHQNTEHWFAVCTTTYKPDGEQRANAQLISACTEMFDAMMAGIRYDNAIRERAKSLQVVRGGVSIPESGGVMVTGDDLGALYMDWINKTRLALQKVLVGTKS